MKNVQISNGELSNIKAWALKTGYPLENDVEMIVSGALSGKNCSLTREYVFPSMDQDGQTKLRSIDFVCSYPVRHRNIPHPAWSAGQNEVATLRFLIDAKSTSESWWFVPESGNFKGDVYFPYLIPRLTEDDFGETDANIAWKEMISAALANTGQARAASGRKFQEGQRDSLADNQVQILQAVGSMHSELTAKIGTTTKADGNYSRNIDFLIPINVTNGKLFIIHDGVSESQIKGAKAISDFCKEVSEVLVRQPNLFSLKNLFENCQKQLGRKREKLGWFEQNLDSVPTIVTTKENLQNVVRRYTERFESNLKQKV